jgi:multiple sugar transport system ATP-binding protein
VLVGPSGSGTTTVLRLTAGLEELTEGEIRIGGRVVNDVHPMDRDIAMVFQNYALYPHMTVAENIGFGLKLHGVKKRELAERVGQAAEALELSDLLKRKPAQLSGGQRQRVAMGRAIVRDPAAFLMDEPLSNLDAKLRVQMRAEIARIQREVGATTIYVTHDQVEAMTMGDRVAVLRKGVLQQVATPQELYERPANLFVASFIGSPAMNLLQARIERAADGGLSCRVGQQRIALPAELTGARPALAARAGSTVGVGIRPEALRDAAQAPGAPADSRLRGRVVTTELLGFELLAHVQVEAEPVATREVLEVTADVDQALVGDLESSVTRGSSVCVGRFDSSSRARAGDDVEMAVDAAKLHFFDLETELAIEAEHRLQTAAG